MGPDDKNVFLFNTEQDPSETTDVFEDYPDVSFSFFFCYFYINSISRMPSPSANKAAHSGFETQRNTSPQVQNRDISVPTERLMSSKFFLKIKEFSALGSLMK